MMWTVCRILIPPPPQHLHFSIFFDSTFKYIDGNGELLDYNGITGANVNPPHYLEVVEDGSAPSAGLILTDPLFFSPSKYLRIDFG